MNGFTKKKTWPLTQPEHEIQTLDVRQHLVHIRPLGNISALKQEGKYLSKTTLGFISVEQFEEIMHKLSNKCILRSFCSAIKYKKKSPRVGETLRKVSASVCD